MPTNLTGSKVKDTYNQILHIDGGPAASEKVVCSGTGVATALSLGTGSASVDNIKIDGNTISSTNTNGNINLTPNGSGAVVVPTAQFTTVTGTTVSTVNAAAHMDLNGSTVTADGSNTNIDITLTPKGTGSVILPKVAIAAGTAQLTTVAGTTVSTVNAAAHLDLSGATVAADGTDTNIDITLTPKGTGSVAIPKVAITAGTVPYNTITNRAYASFYDAGTTDQTGSTTDRTAVKWATAAVAGAGITVASNSRITLAAAGTYRFNASLQFFNSNNTVHTVDLWFAKNGTNIANSGARITVPANNAGGTNLVAYEIFETVVANDYIEMFWHPSNVSATLHYIAPVASNPGVTPAIPAIPPAIVVVQRIA